MAVTTCFFIDCKGELPDLRTTDVLTPALATFPSNLNNVIVYLAEYPDTCWRALKTGNPAAPLLPYSVLNTYTECVTCINAIPPAVNVYILEDCLETANPIYSFTSSLADAVGKVVKLEGSELCWGVSTVVFDDQTITDVVIATNEADVPQIFADCECCLPTPEPTPVKYTRVIPKPDRKFYQIKESQCDIKSNIKFAEGYYRLFKTLKYGIANACDNINLEKLWIKKNLSDLAMINDPTACVITTPVTPVVCPEPTGNPYIPPAPPVTYIFTVGSYVGIPSTFGCVQCLDGTAPVDNLCPQFNLILDYNILDTIDPFSAYAFNYNTGCVWAIGSTIAPASFPDPNLETYTMTSANITSIPLVDGGPSPCTLCGA